MAQLEKQLQTLEARLRQAEDLVADLQHRLSQSLDVRQQIESDNKVSFCICRSKWDALIWCLFSIGKYDRNNHNSILYLFVVYQDLKNQINALKSQLQQAKQDYDNERVRTADLENKLQTKEEEHEFEKNALHEVSHF